MQVIAIVRFENYQLRTYLSGESRQSKVQSPQKNKKKQTKNEVFEEKILEKLILKKIGNAGFRSETALRNADSGTVKNCVT